MPLLEQLEDESLVGFLGGDPTMGRPWPRARIVALWPPWLTTGHARRISGSWSAFGFTVNEVDAVSDRPVDELGGHGNPDRIAALIRKHLDAVADLVVLIPAAAASG